MTTTTKGADNHNKEDPPQGGKICKEGQGKEEGLASAKEVHCTAVQVDNSNAAFLLMVEAMITITTISFSTIASGVLSLLGAGMTMIIPELPSPRQRPGQQQ
jgi:hypothetical protein